MLGRVFSAIYQFFENMLSTIFKFLGNLFGYLFQKLIDFLKILLYPLLLVIGIVFMLIYKIAELGIVLIKVLLGIGKIFVSLIKGIFATLSGFSYTATTPNDGKWTSVFNNVVGGLDYFQFDVIGYILLFMIWFGTAFAALRIISSMRGGG